MEFSIRAKLICLTVFSSSLALLLLLGTTHSASAASVKTNVPTKAAMPQPDGAGASGVVPRTQLPEIERARFAEEAKGIPEAKLAPRYEAAKKAVAEEAYAKQRAYGSSYRPYSYGSSYRPYSYGSSYRPYSYGGYSHGFMR